MIYYLFIYFTAGKYELIRSGSNEVGNREHKDVYSE